MELMSGKVVPGCSNAGNPFHECSAICFERLNSADVHKKEKKLFGFGKRTPSRETPPGSPARGSRSPLASYFAKKKVESESSPSSNDHTNGNFLSRLSPLQGRKNEPANNVDSLPVSPSLALYSGGDYFARRTDQRGGEDDDVSPRPFGTQPKTPEHPLRTPQHRPRTPQHRSAHQEDPISLETRPRTPERRSNTSDTRPRTPMHESAATGIRRHQTTGTKTKAAASLGRDEFPSPALQLQQSPLLTGGALLGESHCLATCLLFPASLLPEMSSLFLSFTSHSRPFPKLPGTFFELRLPPAPPTALPSPPHPPKPPDPPDPQICCFSARLFVSMNLSPESSSGLMLIVECPITAVCRLSPSLVQIWGLMLTVPLSRFPRNSSPRLVEMLPPFTTLPLPHMVHLRSLGFVPMVLPLCLLHPSLESFASESLGVDFPCLTALCSFCCQIRFERISLRCEMGSAVSVWG